MKYDGLGPQELRAHLDILDPPKERACVFCGGRPVSREHVWPKWLTVELAKAGFVVDPDAGTRQKTELYGFNFEKLYGRLELEDRGMTPPLRHLVSRSVCEPCNNGWMSQLEGVAKRVLLSLALGQEMVGTRPELEALSAWAVKTAMMWQVQDPQSLAWDPSDFRHLWTSKTPPPGTSVAVARWDRPDVQGPGSCGGHFFFEGVDRRIGVTTLIIGGCILAVRAATHPALVRSLPLLDRRWAVLWRPTPSRLSWHPHRASVGVVDANRLLEPIVVAR